MCIPYSSSQIEDLYNQKENVMIKVNIVDYSVTLGTSFESLNRNFEIDLGPDLELDNNS